MGIRINEVKLLEPLLLATYHLKLVELCEWCSVRWSDFCITSCYREGDLGVHGTIPCRGIDVSVRNLENPKSLEEDGNLHWAYDQTRPDMKCFLLHDVGKGIHLHLQVCDNTRYLGGQSAT